MSDHDNNKNLRSSIQTMIGFNIVFTLIGYILSIALNTLDRAIFYISYLINGKSLMVHDLRFVGTDRFKNKSLRVSNDGVESATTNTTGPIRNAEFSSGLLDTPREGVYTLDAMFEQCAQQFGDKRCMGARRVLEMNHELRTMPDGSKRRWEVPTLSPVEWQSYSHVLERVKNIGSGLVQWTGLQSGEQFALIEETCMEWMLLAQSCFRYNIKIVTVYATLGDEAMVDALNETNVTALFTNESQLHKFKSLAQSIPTLKYIVFNSLQYATQFASDKNASEIEKFEQESGLKIISLEDLEAIGRNSSSHPAPKSPAKSNDVALIMYTSGTTGVPKGVMIQHRNVLAAVVGIEHGVGDDPSVPYVYCGYLPLAHILELVAECLVFKKGGCIGYGNPKTLTDRGAKPVGDLVAIAPTVMAGVPRVWETVKKGAHEKLSKAPPIARWLFNTAFEARKKAIREGRETPLWNKLVFQKFRALIGGNIRLIISGGAPMNPDSQEFMRVCVGCVVLQGYGLTETCAAVSIQNGYHEFRTGNVGPPTPCCDIKLVDVPEMGYHTSNAVPRGEIAVRGPNVALGYYKREEQTREVFMDDGWFMTGDIGQINEDGTLSVIDRRKNIIKLDHGEYIALEKLESVYGNSPFVSPNGVCVYADPFSSYPVALVLPQQMYAENWARANKIQFSDFSNLCRDKCLQNAVLQSLQEEARNANLKQFEVVREVRCLDEEWTPENGVLTAAMKIKRSEIAQRYKAALDEMYPDKPVQLK